MRVRFSAFLARELPFILMSRFVIHKIEFAPEHFVAKLASEWSLVVGNLLVRSETLFVRVLELVFCKIRFVCERFAAFSTCEPTNIRVARFVIFENMHKSVSFATEFALKWTIVGVNALMFPESLF